MSCWHVSPILRKRPIMSLLLGYSLGLSFWFKAGSNGMSFANGGFPNFDPSRWQRKFAKKKTTSLRMNKLQGEDRDTPQKLTWRWNIHILAIGALHLQKVNFCSSWKPCNHVSSPESVHFPGKTNVSFVQIFHVKGAGDFLEGGKNLPVGRQLN